MRVDVNVCTDLLREKLINNNNFCFLHHAALRSSRDYEEARLMLEGEVNQLWISTVYLLFRVYHLLMPTILYVKEQKRGS